MRHQGFGPQEDAEPSFELTVLNVALVFELILPIVETQREMISARLIAYSTEVGPSSRR